MTVSGAGNGGTKVASSDLPGAMSEMKFGDSKPISWSSSGTVFAGEASLEEIFGRGDGEAGFLVALGGSDRNGAGTFWRSGFPSVFPGREADFLDKRG